MREMKESNIPFCKYIPANWSEMPNKYIFECHSTKVGERSSEYQLLSLTTSGVKQKDPNAGGGKVPESYDNYQTVEKGDIIFCLFDLDVSAVFSGLSPFDGMITSAYDVFRANQQFVDDHFLDYWFQYVFSNRYYKIFSKNIRYTITGEIFKSIYTPIPLLEEQKKIGHLLDSECQKIDALIANQEAQIEKLKQYKQSLITEVVTKGLDPDAPMKNSEVEYLAIMPAHWNVISINLAFEYVGGYAFKSDLFCSETNSQVLRIGNIKNDTLLLEEKQVYIPDEYAILASGCMVKEGDILFSMTGTKGKRDYFFTLLVKKAHLTGKTLYINQRVGLFRRRHPNISMRYMNYVLKEKKVLDNIFLSETGTANQGNLGIENISRTKIYYPPFEEQEKIADYLDDKCNVIDHLISIKQDKIKKLNKYKRSLIYEYVTGKKELV